MRDSLWFVPTMAVVAGGALAVLAVRIRMPAPDGGLGWTWLFDGGVDGARGVLTAIAGSLITVTGTIFSVTIVALQLASSQFTPRLLRSFVADRVNQWVLGTFIGTFTYTLLVLRTIRAAGEGREPFVPQAGVTLALVLLLVSIGALIVFIDHAAQSIRASVILHRETQRTLAQIDVVFPARSSREKEGPTGAFPGGAPAGPASQVVAASSGYVQIVHEDTLWRLAKDHHAEPITVRVDLHVGDFVIEGKPLATVWPATAVDERCARIVREAFVLGFERTADRDVEYGLVEISDIAIKALSPGINDPTTALLCIDRLTEILARLASRHPRTAPRVSRDGTLRLILRHTTFERAIGLAFDQVRHYGAGSPAIARRLLASIADLARVVAPEERGVLRAQATAVLHAARRAIFDPGDLAEVEREAVRAMESEPSWATSA